MVLGRVWVLCMRAYDLGLSFGFGSMSMGSGFRGHVFGLDVGVRGAVLGVKGLGFCV